MTSKYAQKINIVLCDFYRNLVSPTAFARIYQLPKKKKGHRQRIFGVQNVVYCLSLGPWTIRGGACNLRTLAILAIINVPYKYR